MSRIVVVTADLFFRAKVEQVAAICDRAVDVVGSAEDAVRVVGELRPRWVLVDLSLDGAVGLIAHVKGLRGVRSRIVAWGAHVERELLSAAREAGADEALPRSAFVARLPEILSGEPGE